MTSRVKSGWDAQGFARAAVEPQHIRRLRSALAGLRAAVAQTRFPLVTAEAASATRAAARLVGQVDDYLLPRLDQLDAPMLVVVGGSTGAGKSTLVNSLVRAPVSLAGVLRPTTRAPVLITSSTDAAWFAGLGGPSPAGMLAISPASRTGDQRRIAAKQPIRDTGKASTNDAAADMQPATNGTHLTNGTAAANGTAATNGTAARNGPEVTRRSGPVNRSGPLPGMPRTNSLASTIGALQTITAPALPAGLGLIDAPDVDSIAAGNRALAGELLAAADMWLFVTTAARYADAVPWANLRVARDRGTVIAVVLDRVPPGAEDELAAHLGEMLTREGLAGAHLFVLPEVLLDGQGLLPERVIKQLRDWLHTLARDAMVRAAVVQHTLDGAIVATGTACEALATAADQQIQASTRLHVAVSGALGQALEAVRAAVTRGDLLRGAGLPAWREYVATGELARAARLWLRDRTVGRPDGELTTRLEQTIAAGLGELIHQETVEATRTATAAFLTDQAGGELINPAAAPRATDVAGLVRDWLAATSQRVTPRRRGGRHRDEQSRGAAALLVTICAIVGPQLMPTEDELDVAGGAAATTASQVRRAHADPTLPAAASATHDDLMNRVAALLAEVGREFTALLDAAGVDPQAPRRLHDAARTVGVAHRAARDPSLQAATAAVR